MEAVLMDSWKPPRTGCQTNYSDSAFDPDIPHIYEREETRMEQENNGNNQLMRVEEQSEFMPMLSPKQAVARYNAIKDCVAEVLVEGRDFGKIPGVEKKSLLKPGAEKLCTFFGLSSQFAIVEKIEDWTGKEHGGEMFFKYDFLCRLYRGDMRIAECVGSCNSWESKYRYRKKERVCPSCGVAAIMKSKEEYGGGWYCNRNRDGCGERFGKGNEQIESQEVGRIPNPDIADQVNTIQKMAQKRAFVGATLIAVNASDFFTADVEDAPLDVTAEGTSDARPSQTSPPAAKSPPRAAKAPSGGDDEVRLKFRGRPSQAVLTMIKDAGFRWNPQGMIWHAPANPERLAVAEQLNEDGLLVPEGPARPEAPPADKQEDLAWAEAEDQLPY